MTPREIERTLDFILRHGAQTAIHLEQLAAGQGQMQSLITVMTELAQVQSERLDRHNEMFQSMHLWQREALSRLDAILHRLTPDR